ncbi:MAG: type VI secretion system domain-containing protein [Proteobacteria bacterium]|nr:type VI secretion system domain-containing protein [Pseudomonadota bacterium]
MSLLAQYHLRQDPRRALGYQLALTASMLGVVPDGDRAAPALSPRRLRELEQAAREAAPATVYELPLATLAEGGGLSPRAIGLLAQALAALGPEHEAAAALVAGHAAAAALALGSLADLKGDEAAWLGQRIAPILGLELAASRPGSGASSGEDEAPSSPAAPPNEAEAWLDGQLAAANEAAARQGLAAGCHLLQESLDACGLKPDRFRVRLALAELCLAHDAADLAQPMLRDLLDELKQPALEWQPALLVAAATALLTCNQQLAARLDAEAADPLRREAADLLALVARVHPEAACRLRGVGAPPTPEARPRPGRGLPAWKQPPHLELDLDEGLDARQGIVTVAADLDPRPAPQPHRLQRARHRIDDPVVRHPVLRIQSALPHAILRRVRRGKHLADPVRHHQDRPLVPRLR